MFWFMLFTLLLFLWAYARLVLAGPDLCHFDMPVGERFAAHADDGPANAAFLGSLKVVRDEARSTKSMKQGFAVIRDFADNLSANLESGCRFEAVTADGVKCEWAIAPEADPRRRVLFLHGGAFLLGSPKGHRIFSDQLSRLAKAAVLSVDYSLMPENRRMAATLDAQKAYRWILTNGPEGETQLESLLVAGDSAGGNLALMLSGWSKTAAPRNPDGVIAFSPSVDATLAAPSIKANRKTDPLLGEALGFLGSLPRTIALWFGLVTMRTLPCNPLISPLFGELHNLPPTLIHASDSEMLLGDAIRYTNKANAAGSDVTLQIWTGQIHDWHLFNRESGSGRQAWAEVAKFISKLG